MPRAKVAHKPIEDIEGSNKIATKLFEQIIDTGRDFALANMPVDRSSYCVALIDELTNMIASGRLSEGDEWAKDVVRYLQERLEALEECKDEIAKEFSKENAEERISKMEKYSIARKDAPEELKELEKYAKDMGNGMSGISLEDIPEEKREAIVKILKKMGAIPVGVSSEGEYVEEEEDKERFRHYG